MSVIKIPLLHVLLPGAKQVVTTIHPIPFGLTTREVQAVLPSSILSQRDKAGARDGTGARVAAMEGHAIDSLRTRVGIQRCRNCIYNSKSITILL